jgi:hypothetical protein
MEKMNFIILLYNLAKELNEKILFEELLDEERLKH